MTKRAAHINTILEISRQDQVGQLTPWFQNQLDTSIGIGHFADEATLATDQQAIVEWLKAYKEQTGTGTAAMGISGGVDSALTAALLKMAGWRVIGFALPIHQDPTETERGREAAEALQLDDFRVVDLSSAYDTLVQNFGEVVDSTLTQKDLQDDVGVKIRKGNLRARVRMQALYTVAHANNGLVASTDNLSELQAGFWTLHGDVGDISPIQAFNKGWEVPMLAKISGVPEATWRAKPTDGLGIDAGDEAQLGCTYLEWDLMFQAIEGARAAVSTYPGRKEFIIERLDMGDDERAQAVFEAVYNRTRRTWFKRMNPVNFEHPRLGTLQSLSRTDRALFHPHVVR